MDLTVEAIETGLHELVCLASLALHPVLPPWNLMCHESTASQQDPTVPVGVFSWAIHCDSRTGSTLSIWAPKAARFHSQTQSKKRSSQVVNPSTLGFLPVYGAISAALGTKV